jgi:hypothetical protein
LKQIGTNDIADGAVTTSKIADGSVTSSKLAFDVDQPRTATLIVKKIIVNNVGAPFPTASDFLIDVNGDNPLPSRFPGSASGVTVFRPLDHMQLLKIGSRRWLWIIFHDLFTRLRRYHK